MLSHTKTHKELISMRKEIEKDYPRRSLWRSNSTGRLYRITGCTLEAFTYVPRIQFVISGSAGPSFNLTQSEFDEEFDRYLEDIASNVMPS